MPIIKTQTNIEVYKYLARQKDIHFLSGRSKNKNVTEFVNRCIIDKMKFGADDNVVDVGCGDGSLLAQIANQVKSVTGIVPTDEEEERLISSYKGIANLLFIKSRADSIKCLNSFANKTVCNGVMLLLTDLNEVKRAISELSRITQSGGTLWIGEVAIVDEYSGKNYGKSIIKWLWYMLINGDFLGCYNGLVKALKSKFTSQDFIIQPKKMFSIEADRFVELCILNGLELIEMKTHLTIGINGIPIELKSRMNFIFKKVKS